MKKTEIIILHADLWTHESLDYKKGKRRINLTRTESVGPAQASWIKMKKQTLLKNTKRKERAKTHKKPPHLLKWQDEGRGTLILQLTITTAPVLAVRMKIK